MPTRTPPDLGRNAAQPGQARWGYVGQQGLIRAIGALHVAFGIAAARLAGQVWFHEDHRDVGHLCEVPHVLPWIWLVVLFAVTAAFAGVQTCRLRRAGRIGLTWAWAAFLALATSDGMLWPWVVPAAVVALPLWLGHADELFASRHTAPSGLARERGHPVRQWLALGAVVMGLLGGGVWLGAREELPCEVRARGQFGQFGESR